MLVNQGKVVRTGSVDEVLGRLWRTLVIRCERPQELAGILAGRGFKARATGVDRVAVAFKDEEERMHIEAGGILADPRIDLLVTVGKLGRLLGIRRLERGMEVVHFGSTEEAAEGISTLLKPGDVVLVKASRGMKFERIIEGLRGCFTTSSTRS